MVDGNSFCIALQMAIIVLVIEGVSKVDGDGLNNFDDITDHIKGVEICVEDSHNKLTNLYSSGGAQNSSRHHRKAHIRQRNHHTTTEVATDAPTSLTTFQFEPTPQQRASEDAYRQSRVSHAKVTDADSRASQATAKAPRKIGPSSRNKLDSKPSKASSVFISRNCSTVVAQIGTTAIMHCEVKDIAENTVTWIRRKNYSLLSVGLVTYSSDGRFFSAHGKHVKDWALHIRFVSRADEGYYECQVPTHPPTSIFFKLAVVEAHADIIGGPDKIVQQGSMLKLTCLIRKSTEPPSYVFWYHENRMINYDLNGVRVTNGRQSSELIVEKAEPWHGGNYTCVPANAQPNSVTVHIVQSETPAAMQHDKNDTSDAVILTSILRYFLTIVNILIVWHMN